MARQLVLDLKKDGVPIEFLPVDPLLPKPLRFAERIKYFRTLVKSIFYIASLMRQVPKYDVVHIFSASYSSFLVSPGPAIVVGRLFRKQVVLNYHSGEAEDHLQRSGRFTKWLMHRADCIVVQTGFLVSVFRKFGFHATAIPNHVDTSMIPYRQRSAIQPRVLVTRALEPLYNIACALRAFRIFQDRYPAAELVILGDGSQRKQLESLAIELGLSGVTFAGRVEREDIARYYDNADIALNTSSIDNMPVSILEAFAAGLPVVTTKPGGIPWMVIDRVSAHLVDVDDHKAVAERLIALMENPDEVVALTTAGRQERLRYSFEVVRPQWTSLYRQLCGGGDDNSELCLDEKPCEITG
jgi:glycosyltransferase involved in cell wall biosynthesis